TRSLYVQTRKIDGHLSRVIRTSSQTGRDIVHLRPMDERGNLLGPGHASRISIQDDTGTNLLIVDNLDGSYQAELPTSFGTASTLRILVRGKSIHAGTIGADTSAPLTFVSIDRPGGSEAGGLVVNISGRGFLPGASVSFGGVEASDVIVVSDLLIQATVPLGTGDVAIAITNPGGEVTSASETFSYQPVGVIPSDGLPSLDGFGLGGGPVSGNTEPYAQVVVKLDDVAIASFSADVGGRFSGPPNAPIPMVNREYVFGVEAADTSGNSLGQNTYILNTFVSRNVARSSDGRDSGQNALVLVGGASQTFRFIANPGDVEISLYAKLTGNVTPAFVVFGGSVASQALTAVGAPDAAGWVRYSALVSVTTGESTTLTLSVSTPLATPVDATVLVDEITIAEQ
ncbi:MAG: IPT/TIG domain-containing protein, partial [Vicinamibacterales bacterium]|nr:IPT/TIG domain-containing protein [Vicinamibacterales bacterium]